MIKKNSIDVLKNKIDIVDVISNYIDIKKNGANFKAPCPFHQEKTASFVVSPSKQIYHCFGCGAGGDAIKFTQDYLKLDFIDAVEKIASDFNISLEYENQNNSKTSDYQTILEVINKYYEDSLKEQENCLKYLKERGINKNSIKKFELGYAKRSDKQLEFIKNQFLNIKDCLEVGVLKQEKERIYSSQIERITFPIRNHLNKIVGFSGRSLKTDSNIAKYLNTQETKIFNKSRILYGYNLAKDSVFKSKSIIIVEGNIDVILMHQIGLNNSVATLGTALTKEHILLIKKSNADVTLCFDSDQAGKKAAFNASLLLAQSEVKAKVVELEANSDPADMIKNSRVDELKVRIDNAKDSIKYILEYIVLKFDISDAYSKNEALKECVNFLKTINRIIAEQYKGYLAYLLKIKTFHIILEDIKVAKNEVINKAVMSLADEKFLKTLLEKPDFMDLLFENVDYEALDKSYFKALFDNIEDPIIRGIEIRNDIKAYNQKDFIQACKLKQKSYLRKKMNELATSLDNDTFHKMDEIRKKIKILG